MNNICAICLDDISKRKYVKTSCCHEFHYSCINKAILRLGYNCPLCRVNIETEITKILVENKKISKKVVKDIVKYSIDDEWDNIMKYCIDC